MRTESERGEIMNIITGIDSKGDIGLEVSMNCREFNIMTEALDLMFSSSLTERDIRITLAKMLEQIERAAEDAIKR